MRPPLFHYLFLVLLLAAIIGDVARAAATNEKAIAHWDFGVEETTPLIPHSSVHRDQPGPRPPTFPDFDANNTAIKLDGSGAYFSYADPGPKSPFDFTNGDALTIEAWVNVEDLRAGENSYIIGKGRTNAPGFARDNQNWALRVREGDGLAHVSFLFATKPVAGKAESQWHRWTSKEGFAPGSGWHHVAVAYKFGDSKSIRAWIDGKSVTGAWDMGGETTDRETDPNVLQPGVLANSLVSTWITRASQDSELAQLAVDAASPDALIETLFLRFLGRVPTDAERAPLVETLSAGFAARLVPEDEIKPNAPLPRLGRVSWSNHLVPEANIIKTEMERRARAGAPSDPRLRPAWREVYEDVVWSLINTREFVWVP